MSTKTPFLDNFRRHGAFSGIAPPDTTRDLPGARATVFPGAMTPAHLIRVRSRSLRSRISLCRRKFMSTKINFRRHDILFVDTRCLPPNRSLTTRTPVPRCALCGFLTELGGTNPGIPVESGRRACRRKIPQGGRVDENSKSCQNQQKIIKFALRNSADTAREEPWSNARKLKPQYNIP